MRDRRDILGGVFLIGISACFALIGTQYQFGTLLRMGPGFFPMVTSGLLAVLGLAIILSARRVTIEGRRPIRISRIDLRTPIAVLGSVLTFALTVERVGLVVATLLLVGIAALAERRPQLMRTLVLAVALAATSVLLFSKVLGITIPIFRWGF